MRLKFFPILYYIILYIIYYIFQFEESIEIKKRSNRFDDVE